MPTLNRAAVIIVGLAATAALTACTSREPSSTTTSLEPLTPRPAATASPTTPPPASPAATPTPTPRDAETTEQIRRALQAAGQLLDVAVEPDCPQGADCIRDGTVGTSVEQGIIQLAYAVADGSGAALVMALDQDGAWAVWLASQRDVYQLLDLPGQLRVCGGGEGAELREAPAHDAAIIATANDGDLLEAESFVLTEAGSLEKWGAGWYRVTSPVEAWAYSRDVAAAASGDCSLRDVYEKGEEPRG